MKKILITGVCDFVSRYFLKYLNNILEKYLVVGVDISAECPYKYDFLKYQQLDIKDRVSFKKLLLQEKPDYIVHLASLSSVSQSWEHPVESFCNNTNIFLNIVESIRELKLNTRVLSIGSSEEYGNYPASKMPLKEDFALLANNPYSIARVSQEMLSQLYAREYGVDIVMTRSFNHIGPYQRKCFVVSSFVKQLVEISKGNQKQIHVGNIEIIRDFLDVRDVVDAYYKILINGQTGEIYNVCSGNGVKLKNIIDEVSNQLSIKPEIMINTSKIRPTDNMCIIGDNSKLKGELNWNIQYNLGETLKDMINYYMGINCETKDI